MKKHWLTILLFTILIIGLSLVLYPTVANWWNSLNQSKVVANYIEEVANLGNEEYDKLLEDAAEYNKKIYSNPPQYHLNDAQQADYEKQLNITDYGVMGYVEIPKIDVSLPVYHGTSNTVLQVAVGHIEWSSLPVGGENTHCVLSGHRGLPSARLFTDLDQLIEGDIFTLCVLDEVFTYEVDQIRIVEPDEIDQLFIVEGQDYCTLTTCTPYGINSHRMLVRGHRIENRSDNAVRVTADAVHIEPFVVAPFVAIPVLFVMLLLLLIPKSKKNRRNLP